jgi:uncharacterized membrane protein YdcZ (DUF606 family)
MYKIKQRSLSVSQRKKRSAVQTELSRKLPWWAYAGGIFALLGLALFAMKQVGMLGK